MPAFTYSLSQHICLHVETREALEHWPCQIIPSSVLRSSRSQTLLLVSSCNLQRSLFVTGEEPWLWPYSYRVAVASGKFYVQLLLMRWRAQFSIISQESAAQFMSEEHFQSFYMMMWNSETCSCCYEANLFLPVRQIYSWRPGAAIFRRLFWNNPVFLLLCSSYPFLSLTFDQMSLDSGPVSVSICVLFDVSSFLAATGIYSLNKTQRSEAGEEI